MRLRREPERTCVGCRGRAGKTELTRLVRGPDGRVSIDPTGRSPGRGAYVHRAESCIKQAVRRGSLDRALHTSLTKTEAGRLEDELAGTLGEKS